MIYQPRNVQPSGVSIDGLLDNTFTMEIQTNSYVSAYQLLIVDFDNNEIYTGSKTTLTNYAYNGDTLEIPVNASTVALSNGTNYKWRVRLYQPTADMLITYGLVQATSTTTTIYLQPNINIKAGMAITINSQTKTISSYNSDTGVAVVSSAFSSAPAVGTQYKIYSDFIETVPDYIVYARRTPAVAISNVPSSLTLKYHTFQGTYIQSDNVPIVYHKFDLYTKNNDGTISLVASSDKVYSANLSYTYDSFRTGNKYLIQMTVENDMGIITTTDMYEFNVSYDIVEYLQQPLASFDDKNNAVKVSWVTPVEHDATSFRSDAATGIIQDNNNTLTQATFEPGQSIGEGDVVQITNSDCTLVIDGKSEQETTTGKNLFDESIMPTNTHNGIKWEYTNKKIKISGTATSTYSQSGNISITLQAGTYYFVKSGTTNLNFNAWFYNIDGTLIANSKLNNPFTISENATKIVLFVEGTKSGTLYNQEMNFMVSTTNGNYEPYTGGQPSPSPDYPSEIESVGYENLLGLTSSDLIFNRYINTNTGEVVSTTSGNYYASENYIDISSYIGKYVTLSTGLEVAYYTSDKTFISYINRNQNRIQLIPINAHYIRIDCYKDNINEMQITKGTIPHPYIPYGKYGIEVKTTGKNLLNPNKPVNTEISNGITITNNGDGTYTAKGTSTNTLAIELTKPNTIILESGKTYSHSIEILSGTMAAQIAVTVINSDGTTTYNYMNLTPNQLSITKTMNENLIIKRYDFYVTSGVSVDFTFRVQLEEGSEPTAYEPYQSNTSLFQLDQPLRSLPSGVKDIAYIKNNTLYVDRKVGSVVFNGSENWIKSSAYNGSYYFYANTLENKRKTGTYYITNYFKSVDNIANFKKGTCFTGDSAFNFWLGDSTTYTTLKDFKSWLSTHNTQVDYELAEPYTEEVGDNAIPYIDGINYMHISSNMDTTFSLVYPHKTISGNTYDYTEFNPPGVKQTGTIKSYNAITGVGTLMAQYPFTYIPMQGDSYAVISNIYNVSGFSYLYNTPYNTVNSLYTHGYTATWATPDGLCVLPDDFNITLQFSPDGNFFYDQNGVYQEVVNLITTETDDANGEGEFTIKIDKNKLIFVQNPDISLELPFYTNTTQVFVLSSASVAQINNDYVWDDTATWTDTYTWVEGGTSLERVCNHWWKVQITNTGIKIEEIFPTT